MLVDNAKLLSKTYHSLWLTIRCLFNHPVGGHLSVPIQTGSLGFGDTSRVSEMEGPCVQMASYRRHRNRSL